MSFEILGAIAAPGLAFLDFAKNSGSRGAGVMGVEVVDVDEHAINDVGYL